MNDIRDSYTKEPERPLATIERIIDIQPIPKADQIVVATVLGWKVVIRKSDGFKIGDYCVYCQIDSVLPSDQKWCEFLEDRKYRIKTIRLRKQISQGIIFPLDILPKNVLEIKENIDVTKILNIRQYIPPELRVKPRYLPKPGKKLSWWQKIKNHFFVKRKTRLRQRLIFPTNIVPKTKETRIQNSPSILQNHKNDLVSITEKIDGMSMTIIRNKGKYELCSRNWKVSVEMNGEDMVRLYETAFKNEKIESKLSRCVGNYAIQGEIVGPGVTGSGKGNNIYELLELQMYVFNVWDIDAQCYLNYFKFKQFTHKYKLRTVPALGNIKLPGTIDEMVKISEGKSLVNPKITREGVVVRARDMHSGTWDFSFKCISPKYLLKHEG